MDFHVLTSRGAELIMRTLDGELVIVPPAAPARPLDQSVRLDADAPAQQAPAPQP